MGKTRLEYDRNVLVQHCNMRATARGDRRIRCPRNLTQADRSLRFPLSAQDDSVVPYVLGPVLGVRCDHRIHRRQPGLGAVKRDLVLDYLN